MQGFKACAWRDWQPEQKKSRPPKMRARSLKNDERTRAATPKSEATPHSKSEHIELVPIPTHSAHRESANATASIHRLPLIAGGRMQPIRNYH